MNILRERGRSKVFASNSFYLGDKGNMGVPVK
jgi:hypothetical protein